MHFRPGKVSLVCLWLLAAGAPVAAQTPKAADAAVAAEALEPAREDLLRAYGERITAVNAGAAEVFPPDEAAQVQLHLEAIQKLACQRIEREGLNFDCRVEARLRIADQRPKTSVVNLWLEKADNVWIVR